MTWRVLLEAAEAVRAPLVKPATADPRIADPRIAGLPIAGIGWATVELERAQRELDGLLAADRDAPALRPWIEIERDAAVGARGTKRAPADAADAVGAGGGPSLVVLEPDTEGPLAAFLARFGEGVGVIYLGEGPLRAGQLLRGGPAWGPHIVVLVQGEA